LAVPNPYPNVRNGSDHETTPGPHQRAIRRPLRQGRPLGYAELATLGAVEDYTSKYKGEQVEVAHIELNGHILVPLQNIASLHCSSRCDAPQNEDWPPRGLLEDDGQDDGGEDR